MNCFYHPELAAVGTCGQCQKTACRQCIDDVGGALLCVGCFSLNQRVYQQQVAAEQQVTKIDRDTAIRQAQARIRWSWIIGGVAMGLGFIFGIVAAFSAGPRDSSIGLFFIGLFVGYAIWAMYWSVPLVWKGVSSAIDSSPLVLIILLATCFIIPLFAAYIYGVFGGGIYEFLKNQKIAAGQI
jgi:hypothetical protein